MWEQLKNEGRVHNPEAERYLGMICNFFPRHMTPEECEGGVWRCFQKFYSWRSIFRRLLWPPTVISFKDCPAIYSSTGLPAGILTRWISTKALSPGSVILNMVDDLNSLSA